MAVTGLYILNEALKVLQEFITSSEEITADTYDSVGLTALNLTRREIAEIVEGLGYWEKIYTLSTVTDQADYDITTLQSDLVFDNILKDEVFFSETKTPLKFATARDMAQQVIPKQGVSYQRFYKGRDTTGKELFSLYPIPDEDDVEIIIPYEVAITADLTKEDMDTDMIIPYRHLNAWILGTASNFAMMDEREKLYSMVTPKYELAKELMVAKGYKRKLTNRLEPSKHWQNIFKNGR